jgi:lipoyl-dependent peroxiredoxin subunit C
MTMIKVGDKLPEFSVDATVSMDLDTAFERVTDKSYEGKWKVLFFWPKDFTFVCPTELVAFNDLYDDFHTRGAQLLGASVDTEFVHLAWKQSREDLGKIKYPMLADVKRELSQSLGILDDESGVSQRAVFIIDDKNIVRFSMVTDMSVGRNTKEVLRVLDALQTDSLCPCNWKKGDDTL